MEEFLAQHPEHADDDENALMEARIDHEKAEREALEQQRQELLKRKQKLIADNKKRRDDLANLDKDLEKFIDVCLICRYLIARVHTDYLRRRNQSRSCSRRLYDGLELKMTIAMHTIENPRNLGLLALSPLTSNH